MKTFQIWREGFDYMLPRSWPTFHYWHNHGPAKLLGEAEGEDFKSACVNFINLANKEYLHQRFDSDKLTLWNCKLYDNETDAKKTVSVEGSLPKIL